MNVFLTESGLGRVSKSLVGGMGRGYRLENIDSFPGGSPQGDLPIGHGPEKTLKKLTLSPAVCVVQFMLTM